MSDEMLASDEGNGIANGRKQGVIEYGRAGFGRAKEFTG
jgi:hypothetical protein